MTLYDEEQSGPDFTPAYGVQLHDPHLLEYVGAPESARLLSRSPEYWAGADPGFFPRGGPVGHRHIATETPQASQGRYGVGFGGPPPRKF